MCLSDFLGDDMEVVSFGNDIVFVPGGFGSIEQGLDLGSEVLEMDGGSAILMDQGSAILGS